MTGNLGNISLIGLTLVFVGHATPCSSQPRELVIGVEIVDQVDAAGMPPHLLRVKPLLLDNLHQDILVLFKALGRCKAFELSSDSSSESQAQYGAVDFFAQVFVRQLHKSYRNKQYLGTSHDIHIADELYYEPGDMEVISEPILIAQLELGLVDARKGKRFWSRMSDSTAAIPHGRYDYIFNPAKHPGATHPEMLQNFMADILRLTNVPRSPLRHILEAADRWFISEPRDDIDTARGLLVGLAASFYTGLDGNLPLEGEIVELLPEEKGKRRVLLNIGAVHGVSSRLKLDVWRPLPAAQKVGQVQVVQVDSTTAVARVRKIDKKLRKLGEGIQSGDRVISKKRKSTRTWSAPIKNGD